MFVPLLSLRNGTDESQKLLIRVGNRLGPLSRKQRKSIEIQSVAAGGGGRGGQLPPGAGTRGAPAKANKKKARPTKQRENNDSIQV